MKSEKLSVLLSLLLIFTITAAWSAEVRTWTNLKGQSFEGTLIKMERDVAVIQQKGGRTVRIERKILSAGDNAYLAEYGGAGAAIMEGAKVGLPEKSVKIDKSTFKELDDVFIFPDTEYDFKMFQSDHFLVMTHGRVSPKNIAETAERLWHGMAFQHPGFQEKWGEMKRAIFIIEDDDVYEAVGEYYMNFLDKQGDAGKDEAMKLAITWPKVVGSPIPLPQDVAGDYGLFQRGRVYRVTDDNDDGFRRVFTPFITNTLAGDMVATQAGGVSSFGGQEGYFSIKTGHAYYKEIQLAGRTGTSIASTTYDSTDISKAKGFADGTSWADELKKMVRRDKVTPSLQKIYSYKAETIGSVDMVLLYSLNYYMQSTPQRLANYAKLLKQIDSSQQVPKAEEMAGIFGFETVEEFDADWKAFLESTSFK